MYNIAVVEDDLFFSDQLVSYIKRYGEENNVEFDIATYSSGLSFISGYSANFDMVFMDIDMAELNGLETACELRKLDQAALLFFVTNMAQFAIQGYEVNAQGFMVKPVSYFNFSEKLKRAISVCEKKTDAFVFVKGDVGTIKLAISDIYFIYTAGRYVRMKTTQGDLMMQCSMKKAEEDFAKHKFVRCDNSFLINLSYVSRISKDTVYVQGHAVPISRAKKKVFTDALTIYVGRRLK